MYKKIGRLTIGVKFEWMWRRWTSYYGIVQGWYVGPFWVHWFTLKSPEQLQKWMDKHDARS